MSKPLYIAELQIGGNGVRTLAPQKIKLHLKEGALVINGKSGTGKTTLQEVIRLVTQGTSAKRDSNLLKNGEEETEFRVKIAELKNPNGAGFYIRSRVKNTGEVINTFQIDFDGKQKNTDVPIDGLGKMTVSKLQNLMSTTLTYGIDDFLSEDAIRVRQFIFDTFQDELVKLGLVIKKGESGYEDSIAGRIEKAIAERDDIQREQSKLGAYGVNLEGLVQPEFIPLEQFNSRRDAILQEIADAKAESKNASQIRENKLALAESEARNILQKGEAVKKEIEQWNQVRIDIEAQLIKELKYRRELYGKKTIEWMDVAKTFDLSENARDAVLTIEKVMDDLKDDVHNLLTYRPAVLQIPTIQGAEAVGEFPEDAVTLMESLSQIRDQYTKAIAEVNKYKAQAEEKPNDSIEKVKQAEQNLTNIDVEISHAQETNELFRKFEVLEQYREADKNVKELYAERNKLYMQINCGVKGLNINILEEDGKSLGFFYNGNADLEYFTNPDGYPRPLTSYSKSQKIYIAAMLQCYLMSKKQYPLNVLCVDDTGMDKKIHQLWDNFSKKYGLMILVTSTNDKEVEDIGSNEILIENGEILIHE